jgi:hypothetical protein
MRVSKCKAIDSQTPPAKAKKDVGIKPGDRELVVVTITTLQKELAGEQ